MRQLHGTPGWAAARLRLLAAAWGLAGHRPALAASAAAVPAAAGRWLLVPAVAVEAALLQLLLPIDRNSAAVTREVHQAWLQQPVCAGLHVHCS